MAGDGAAVEFHQVHPDASQFEAFREGLAVEFVVGAVEVADQVLGLLPRREASFASLADDLHRGLVGGGPEDASDDR